MDEIQDVAASYPSLVALTARHGLINPMDRLLMLNEARTLTLSRNYNPMDKDLACDIHVVNLRTMLKSAMTLKPSDQSALILHRQGFNGCYKPVGMTCSTNGGKVSFFHFGSNSLRRVHVFLRHLKKTYHPFFEPEMGVLTPPAPFQQKRPK